MKRTLKTVLGLLLVVCKLLSTACGSKTEAPKDEGTTSTENTTEAPAESTTTTPEGPVVLKVGIHGDTGG